ATSPTDISPLSLHDALPIFPVIAIAVAVPCGTVIPIIAARIHHAHVKHVHFHEAAFPVSKFALFILAISCDDAERLVGSHGGIRSEEHTSELQSRSDLVCRL